MDILKMGADLLAQKMGSSAGGNSAMQDAIGNLLSNADGKLDLGSIVAGLQKNGLGSVAASWLGDGDNKDISTDEVKDLFGSAQIEQTAQKLDMDEGSVLNSLKDVLPQLVDKSSSGGSLLDSVGGVAGLAGLAKKFL